MSDMVVTYEGFAEGELLWDYSDAKLETELHRAGWGWRKKLTCGYLVLLMAGLLAWFLYSLVSACLADGAAALVSHLSALFGLVVCELILGLSAFGGWGKFARLGARVHLRGARARMEAAEVARAEANRASENALRIYENAVVVVNGGVRTVLDRMHISKVICIREGNAVRLRFEDYGGDSVAANIPIPSADFPMLNKLFGKIEAPAAAARKSMRARLPMLLLPIPFFLAGAALIVLHFTLLAEFPWEAGALFCIIPAIVLFAAFDDFAIVRYGVLPIAAGLAFTSLPILLASAVSRIAEMGFWEIVGTFTIVHAVCGVFFGLGPILLLTGAAGIADCIRYRG